MKDYIVRQNDISDCGACALSSIIKFYGGFVPLEIIKVDTLTTNNGTSFYNIKEAAIKYGFEVNGYNENISNVKCPYIVQLKINNLFHFVVVYEIFDNVIVCMDPAYGIKKYSKEEFNYLFTGNILKLNPINKIVIYHKNNYFKDFILKMIKNNSLFLSIILILSFIIIGLSLISTYSIKLILNRKIKIFIIFIILLILKNILNYIKNYLVAHLNKTNNINLIKNYINHIFFLPFKYLQLKDKGEIVSRINDLNNIKDFFTKDIINIIVCLVILISSLIIMFYLYGFLTLILLILSIIYLFINYLINKNCFNYYLKYLDSESNLMNQIIEYINNIKSIKNLGKENYFLNKLNVIIENNGLNSYALENYLNKIGFVSSIFNDLGLIIIILFSFNISIDNIFIYILYYNYYIDNINYIANLISNFNYFMSVLSRINGIYYLDKEDLNDGLKMVNGDIKISNLDYEINLNKVFSNYSVSINNRNKVLIKGPNGIGKSTLLNILNGNIDNYQGNITINNLDLKDISKSTLKENVLYSGDSDNLFMDTIINNIILDKPYDKKKLSKIIEIVDLTSIINKKENGFNTLIKDNLSRGERQRIILARALYQNPKILLLDESLSEVNYQLRTNIIRNMNNYYKDKTIIYISHNLENNHFDKIINLTARKE